jgi:hypothetical protein
LKNTHEEKLLEDIFGGETVNQIISMDCNHATARSEPFFTLSLEVKDNYKLQNSLDLYIKSDILEGDNKYHCSSCNAKVMSFFLFERECYFYLVYLVCSFFFFISVGAGVNSSFFSHVFR